ncbi:ATP-binding cassette domain-containing protein [Enterococcus mediterraneensis]|uniref:ATP-binding cassette domain-containing protein n=1 Tax=Enterococcus mediterraneensis TaxID=2364791 RepID=UPI000F0666A0|nr:excinuclease ABC subunit UvrA [Enterococcus mediterraneensis]
MKIEIRNAHEKNLKHIDLDIPRNQFTVITGLSGSGKTTLVKDTLYMEAQRQYLEAMNYQGIQKPKVDEIRHLSPAILIDQEDRNENPRSTLGTQTDIFTDLRMIFEKLHTRQCPNCQQQIAASDAKEETEKIAGQFHVYMYCPNCNYRMDKLTRSHFSFNTKEGACPTCHGLGKTLALKESKIYDSAKSLEEGAVTIWAKGYRDYQTGIYYNLLRHLKLPVPEQKPLTEFTEEQWLLLKKGINADFVQEIKMPKKVQDGRFDGIDTKIWQKISESSGVPAAFAPYVGETVCPDCHGAKLNPLSRSATVFQQPLPEIESWDLLQLKEWLEEIAAKMTEKQAVFVRDYLQDILTKIKRIDQVGLAYLSLNRSYATLSGGEAQRIKLAAVLDSPMTELIYLLDEPTIGLHPNDTDGVIKMIKNICDRQNTVVVIEHDESVIQQADWVIEIGPKSGVKGGEILASGTYDHLRQDTHSLLYRSQQKKYQQDSQTRSTNTPALTVDHARTNNLKDISLTIPAQCLTVVTGVSGSGKSSLVFNEIAETELNDSDTVRWESDFRHLITISQKRPARNRRSIIATYLDLFDKIRALFADAAKQQGKNLKSSDFSFNSGEGRCPNCQGLGTIESNQLFFQNIEITCPECHGTRYKEEVLAIKVDGRSIYDVLMMDIPTAIEFLSRQKIDTKPLVLLQKTNLDYVTLGQSTDTLSGGEMQRLRLAAAIAKEKQNKNLFLMDEPTTGMHKIDVYHFMELIQQLTNEGNTFIFIEHNLDVIRQADYVIELGPIGGKDGGHVTFSGPIGEFLTSTTQTAKHLN